MKYSLKATLQSNLSQRRGHGKSWDFSGMKQHDKNQCFPRGVIIVDKSSRALQQGRVWTGELLVQRYLSMIKLLKPVEMRNICSTVIVEFYVRTSLYGASVLTRPCWTLNNRCSLLQLAIECIVFKSYHCIIAHRALWSSLLQLGFRV